MQMIAGGVVGAGLRMLNTHGVAVVEGDCFKVTVYSDKSPDLFSALTTELTISCRPRNLLFTGPQDDARYTLGPGQHELEYCFQSDGASFLLRAERITREHADALILVCWFSDRHLLDRVVEGALKKYQASSATHVYTYHHNTVGMWSRSGAKSKRSMDTLALNNEALELLKDARNFLSPGAADIYAKTGAPHRRGYLLYGPPGTGKTSFVWALASEFDLPIYVLCLSPDHMTDDVLHQCFRNVPSRSLILVEDLDALQLSINEDEATPHQGRGRSGITLGGLLNAFDGISGYEGSILVCTTNHVDRIGLALGRAGRFHKRVHFAQVGPERVHEWIGRLVSDDGVRQQLEEVFNTLCQENPNADMATIQEAIREEMLKLCMTMEATPSTSGAAPPAPRAQARQEQIQQARPGPPVLLAPIQVPYRVGKQIMSLLSYLARQ